MVLPTIEMAQQAVAVAAMILMAMIQVSSADVTFHTWGSSVLNLVVQHRIGYSSYRSPISLASSRDGSQTVQFRFVAL